RHAPVRAAEARTGRQDGLIADAVDELATVDQRVLGLKPVHLLVEPLTLRVRVVLRMLGHSRYLDHDHVFGDLPPLVCAEVGAKEAGVEKLAFSLIVAPARELVLLK